MNDSATPIKLSTPRIKQKGPLLIAGLRIAMTENAGAEIPQLWQKVLPYFGQLPQQINGVGYGVCMQPAADHWQFNYMAGCAVWDITELPSALDTVTIPAQRYAIFSHDGHVSQIHQTVSAIFDQWLPAAAYQQATRPLNSLHFLEYYGEQFDGETGIGDMEIWLPIK